MDEFVTALRNAAPYVHSHRGRRFVIALPGEAAASASFAALIYDIALLHSLGAQIVLVHGARPQIDQALSDAGLEGRIHDGSRVTDAEAMTCIKAAVGRLRIDIEAILSTSLTNTPMGGARLRVEGGNLVTARPVGVRGGVDFQFTGEVRRVDVERIANALDRDALVLLSPLGYSPTGEVFNLRYEEVAASVASAMAPHKLLFAFPNTPYAGGQYPADRVTDALGDDPLLKLAAKACANGVQRVHLIDSEQDGSLLRELYSRDGVGLMIYADRYESLRQAGIDDVGGILGLIEPLEREGALVERSREQLELEIERFHIMARDNAVIACAALYANTEEACGELACLAVHPDYRGQGRAEAMLECIEERARAMNLKKLFVLTTQALHWFEERGFVISDIDQLPLSKRELYNYQRNSRVLIKPL